MAELMAAAAATNGAGIADRVTIVVITHNRRPELLATLDRLTTLPEQAGVIVVDNASSDGTADAVREGHPTVTVIEPGANLGAIGRNLAVAQVRTPYVAFADDDTWWDPGAISIAVGVLDEHPDVAVVTGHIVVEPSGRDDPIDVELRDSPVRGRPGLPGPALMSFLAGASVVRRCAFDAVGGFDERLWLGGEEELMASDLLAAGWWLVHRPDVVVHHQASSVRDADLRRRHGIRNTLWFTWLRRPAGSALRRTARLLTVVPGDLVTAAALADAVRGLPWVLRERRPVAARVEQGYRLVEDRQLHGGARRYVS